MRVIANSKYLARKLSEVDFDFPYEVALETDVLIFKTQEKAVKAFISPIQQQGKINHLSARWDWVYQTLKEVSEQPVVLLIGERSVQVIFQY